MTWVWLTLLNVVANGTSVALYKVETTKHKKPYAGVIFVSFLVASLVFLPYSLAAGLLDGLNSVPLIGWVYWGLGLLVAVSAFFLYIRAINLVELSVVGPIENLRPLFVILFSLIFLGQKPTAVLLAGVGLIVFGAVLVNYHESMAASLARIKNERGLHFILGGTVLFALAGIVDKLALSYFTPGLYTQLIILGLTLVYGAGFFSMNWGKWSFKSLVSWRILAAGILIPIALLSIITALALSEPNLVIPVQMTRTFYLALLGFWWFGEKGYLRKLVAGGIMFAGVMLLVR
jgi:drug/metabolite transporter (DMT)-like permease